MRTRLILVIALVLVALPLCAQTSYSPYGNGYKPWDFHFGIGYPIAIGATSNVANSVFRMETGAIKNFNEKFGLRFDGSWDRFHPTGRILDLYQATGGYANVWGLSADGQYRMGNIGHTATYLFGGIGTHYKQTYLTEPGVGWYCDPWWGICYPVGTNVVTGKHTDTAVGANGGIGAQWPLMNGSGFYVEAKYQWINGDFKDVEFIPITIGWRW